MNFSFRAYRFFSSGLFLSIYPYLLFYKKLDKNHSNDVNQRFGKYPETLIYKLNNSFPKIWIHAVSVGEVSVACSIIDALKIKIPDCGIILSTSTSNGLIIAKEKIKSNAICIYAPFDFIVSVKKALAQFKPNIMVFLETEIWPNWIFESKRMGIKTAIINGRISVRSIKRYLKIKPLISEILLNIDAFSMISEDDASRIKMLGANPQRINVNGNAKYDALFNKIDKNIKETMLNIFQLKNDIPVIVAGSTRTGEEEMVLDAFSKIDQVIPNSVLIIAPRHVNRALEIKKMTIGKGFSCQLRTQLNNKREAKVVILDTVGELMNVYSIASIVFCGGSLVPLGGQNVLEAAAWGIPVCYGPSMDDFKDAKELLEVNGAGIQVKDGKELTDILIYYLKNPIQAKNIGKKAREAILLNSGAANRHSAVICQLLNEL